MISNPLMHMTTSFVLDVGTDDAISTLPSRYTTKNAPLSGLLPLESSTPPETFQAGRQPYLCVYGWNHGAQGVVLTAT